ncbi:MAG: hypothetical protein HQL87_09540 [Magnetococcales bacterium]|nr:hypothetical protein [Magnetococcales bacterium]
MNRQPIPPPDLTRPPPGVAAIRHLPAESVRMEAYHERSSILEYEAGIPQTPAEWLAALMVMDRPGEIPESMWNLFKADTAAFLAHYFRPQTARGRG